MTVIIAGNYDKIIESTIKDDRLVTSHLKAPGPNGDFGYGGYCFAKDINALISVFINNNILPKCLLQQMKKIKKLGLIKIGKILKLER
jgi:UDP-glucose 6-dehydrogenase